MRAVALAVVALVAGPGCATSWVAIQASGKQAALDESVREVRVPQPDLIERLRVDLPAAAPGVVPSLSCTTEQAGTDATYHAAYRYGRTWKIATATMFFLEAGASALLLLASDKPTDNLSGGLLGVDALGTAALFFAPRKEIYRRDDTPFVGVVRGDCPAGLTLSIDGEGFAVDPDGRLGEVGVAALDAWMVSGGSALQVDYGGQARDLVVMAGSRCQWQQARSSTLVPGCMPRAVGDLSPVATATLPVAVGTLSAMPTAPAEADTP
jgi:hypothetical protein